METTLPPLPVMASLSVTHPSASVLGCKCPSDCSGGRRVTVTIVHVLGSPAPGTPRIWEEEEGEEGSSQHPQDHRQGT